jgi:hypothetical protein
MVGACPPRAVGDEKAFEECATALDTTAFVARTDEPFLWGQQQPGGRADHIEEHNTTKLHPLVFQRMYLPLFMFDGTYRIEPKEGNVTVVHLPVHFRRDLPMGSFPYPFWHSKKKWDAYQTTTELLIVTDDRRIRYALRSDQFDQQRAKVDRDWDGQWEWTGGEHPEPHVTLFRELFGKENAMVPALDASYRTLEKGLRKHNCASCHAPDNGGKAKQLAMLIYPNQALAARHTLVEQIENNAMPPGGGISDPVEKAELLRQVKDFAARADEAFDIDRRLHAAATH